MSPDPLTRILAIWFVANLSLVTVWDLWVVAFVPERITVSRYLYDLGQSYPALYLWLGIAIGHILMPLVLVANGANR